MSLFVAAASFLYGAFTWITWTKKRKNAEFVSAWLVFTAVVVVPWLLWKT